MKLNWPIVVRCCVFTTLVALTACESEPPPPEGLLPRDRFKEVFLETELLEARASLDQLHDQRDSATIFQRYDSLFAREKVTREAFQTTFNYYNARPEEFKAIHEEVLTELTRRKDAGM